MRPTIITAALGFVAASAPALAITELQIDVNILSVQARDAGGAASAFGGVTHTGRLDVTENLASLLAGVSIDGINQALSAGLANFEGEIQLNAGVVAGGFFNILATDGSSYNAQIVPNSGSVGQAAGQGFVVEGLTFNGTFNQTTFAGVNVSELFGRNLPGTFLQFKLNPNQNGFDDEADLDLSTFNLGNFIPLPSAAGLGFAALGLLAAGRRRTA